MATWRDPIARIGLVLLGSLIYAILTFSWFSLPATLTLIIDEVGLSGTQAGLLAGAVPLTYIPLALFSGLAVDRIGPARSLGIALFVIGGAQIARSVSPGFPSLLVSTLLLGIGATLVTFGLPKLVSVLFPPERTGFPSSIYLVGSSAGSGAAFAIGRPVGVPMLGGWRQLFFWTGVVAIGYGLLWLALMRITAKRDAPNQSETGFEFHTIRDDLEVVLGHRDLRLVVFLGVTYLLVIHGLQGWLPTILESRGLSPATAGQATTVLVGANVLGVLTIPALADRYRARRIAIVSASALCGLGVFTIAVGGISPLVLAGIVGAGLGVGGLSPMVRAIPPSLDGIGQRLTATSVGLVFAVGEIGGFGGPFLIGVLHDITGSYLPGLAILATSGALALVAGLRLRVLDRP